MRIIKCLIATAMLLGVVIQVSAKDKEVSKVYMFGFAASFNDSTIYITDIQEIKWAYVAERTKFLVHRDEYSYQLRNYLQGQGNAFPTCITSYAYDRKTIEKKFAKIKKRYIDKNKGRYIIVNISKEQFTYQPVSSDEVVNVDESEQTVQQSKSKKKK